MWPCLPASPVASSFVSEALEPWSLVPLPTFPPKPSELELSRSGQRQLIILLQLTCNLKSIGYQICRPQFDTVFQRCNNIQK